MQLCTEMGIHGIVSTLPLSFVWNEKDKSLGCLQAICYIPFENEALNKPKQVKLHVPKTISYLSISQ